MGPGVRRDDGVTPRSTAGLAPDNLDDPAKLRDAVQTVTLLALRAVGVMDARARGLVVQAVLPAKMLVGA